MGTLRALDPLIAVRFASTLEDSSTATCEECPMTNELRSRYTKRDKIMKLLSDDEVARVSTAETARGLAEGDEYLDLEHLDRGVLRAPDTHTPMGHVLPKKALHALTWTTVLAELKAQD